ncbi:hypothetical protein F0310_04990 (plasmid) [Borrelia sp. A-FGy1]|uniref:hypothetical protein n=1 Tax=Borrelia sp. A-FGy1 TaxID=2608247 RepID=UPI0015F40FAB|nr:hypothetical protein [Borrelia sp. A-FGy1]QMU99773.1 hypothetical protein F0310_04990 [Borrelia sp. A-FGy1]
MRVIRYILLVIIKYILLIIFIFFCLIFIGLLVMGFSYSSKKGEYYSNGTINSVIVRKSYFKEFDSGNIKSILFKKLDVNVDSKIFKELDEIGKRNLIDSYPLYHMEFVIVDNGFLMNFKNVIFNGIEASLYKQHHMLEPAFESPNLAYFQIGNYDVKTNDMMQYSVRVVNVFKITFNNALFKALLKQKILKFTLIANNNKEYTLRVDNFLSKYDFQTSVKEQINFVKN